MYFYAARQPILNRNKELIGYELLFRDSLENVFPNINEDEATSRLIEGSQLSLGLEDMTGDKPAFINFTLETLVKGYAKTLGTKEVVVEILETVQPGKRLLAAVKELKEMGYTIALDDYKHAPVWRHFYPFVDIIKIDWLDTSIEQIKEIIEQTKDFPSIQFLAEKVETPEQFEQAMELGFHYFQGFFFAKPEVVQSRALAPNEMTLAELLYQTSSPEMDLKKVTEVFERDVNLSYKLLRYSNSAAFKRRAEISTIKQALVVLGVEELKRFLSVLFTAQVASDKPPELMRLCLTRAKFAELLSEQAGQYQESSKAFLTGMLSLIDGILDQSMESILEKLPLSEEIKLAILKREGRLAEYLGLVEAYEKAMWNEANEIQAQLKLNSDEIPTAYHDALQWANIQMDTMSK
ncbi:EAL and HDOD domain-containing protein [Pseudoalteromonas sp. G4]|uniref:EAL and HDOD domain-containing protein n=1 Tax=Pseudoalteromonas sp. G4 TaxID=2992761 RepID=UPI00237EBC03|nr:HDOD domain-containing protein [Pseudoalteromonas sp. G4]MDE3271141.1 HDOD domain-containing protein [Pseudoalteromonas sp. G4]